MSLLQNRRGMGGLRLSLGNESTGDQNKPTEKKIFDDTKKFIIDTMNAYEGEYKFDTEIRRINTIIDDMDVKNTDDSILTTLTNCEQPTTRSFGRPLSTGCVHGIAIYYHCNDSITGIKTYTFQKVKAKEPVNAPYIAGDRPKYEEQHYTNCKYKIAREIMLQIYANAVSKLRRDLFYVPEIKSFGIFTNTDEKSVDDAEVVNEKKYFIEMEHIEGITVNDLTDNRSKLETVVKYLYDEFQIQHGDIKYNNIYWNGDIPTLIDWGEATCDDKPLQNWYSDMMKRSVYLDSNPPPVESPPVESFGGHIRQKRKTQKNKKRKSYKNKKRKSRKKK